MSPRSLTDCTGRYRLLFEPLLMLPDEHQPRVQKLLSTAIGQYRPLPQARAFHYSRARNKHAIGGNRCLGPDTLIDCPDGAPRRVADIKGVHRVWAWDGSKRVPATASEPWIKGIEPCYRVTLSNGDQFDCSAEHRVMRSDHQWIAIRSLQAGDFLLKVPDYSDGILQSDISFGAKQPNPKIVQLTRRSEYRLNRQTTFARRRFSSLSKIHDDVPPYVHAAPTEVSGFQDHCSAYSHQRDGQPLLREDPSRSFGKLPTGAGVRTPAWSHWDARVETLGDIQKSSQPFPWFFDACASEIPWGLSTHPYEESQERSSDDESPRPCIRSERRSSHTSSSHRNTSDEHQHQKSLSSLEIFSIALIGDRPIYDLEVPFYQNYVSSSTAHHNSSKSESLLVDGLLQALDLHPVISRPKPMNIWYASKTFQLIGQFLYPKLEKYLADWPCTWSWHSRRENIPASVRINNHYRDALITFRAYEQGRETFQAAELDLALFDEQYPEDIYIETQTRKGAGRLLYFGSAVTPIDPQPWYEELIMGKLPSNMEVFNYPLDDNRTSRGGFIADEEIDAMIEIWPEEVVETRRNGKFGSYIGAIYQSFARTTHVVPENMEHLFLNRTGKDGQTIIDPRSYAIGAIDWGGANPMAVLWACRIPHMDDCWYIFDEYYWDSRKRGQRRLEDHATEIKTRTSERWETVLARTYADHDPTDAYEMFGHGVPSTPAEKAVKPGIEHMQTLFKPRKDHAHPWIPGLGRPRIFIAERCENLARQLSTYHWSEGVSGKNAKEEPAKVDDHACFVASTRIETLRGKVPINEVEVGDMALTREGFHKVTHVMRTSPDCAVIGRGFSDGTYLYGTANHPIWVVGLGWKPLGELLSSDIVEGLDGHRINVLPLSRGAKRQSVFNITVDYAHEYYANGILVANCDASRYLCFSDRLNGPDGGTIEVLDTSGESWNQRTF